MNYGYPYLNNSYGCSYFKLCINNHIMDSHNGLHILLSTIEQTYVRLPIVQLWISIIQLWLSMISSICVVMSWFIVPPPPPKKKKKMKGVRFSGSTVIIILLCLNIFHIYFCYDLLFMYWFHTFLLPWFCFV